MAMLIRQTQPPPLFQNTWRDGLYIVFSTVADAGRFALKLAKRVSEIDRDSVGLPKDMTLRISLPAGPVYRYKDQIIDKFNYIGSHVNRAARIEPVTPPGQIYVTDAFAAFAELEIPGHDCSLWILSRDSHGVVREPFTLSNGGPARPPLHNCRGSESEGW
jgi:class 3 adenylate cyclase